MKLCKFCILVTLMLFSTFNSFAQDVVLNSCYVVHKDKDMEGKKKWNAIPFEFKC